MTEEITKLLKLASENVGIINPLIKLEHPDDISHGDFSSNVAMVYAKALKVNPKVLAEKIVEEFNSLVSTSDAKENILEAVVAGPGFINFKLADSFFINKIVEISNDKKGLEDFGKIKKDSSKQIMVEYTDPNPFKVFHIGHLMANTIGESLSRLIEFSGAEVIRACYQGDVGLHVAKTVWAIKKDGKYKDDISYLGAMYVLGSSEYETNEQSKKEIVDINKKVFEKSDEEINQIYEAGRKLSLEYFDTIYAKLGTKFNNFFFESEVADDGIKIVNEFLKKDIFEKSEGAIVFPGEKYGEHTRVFINSQGLPTYEAKELGLTKKKFELYPKLSESVVVTANEQNAYFKVLLACINIIYPAIGSKMKHLSHGILRPSTGKMSSRKGNVVSADDLITEFESLVTEKTKDRDFSESERSEINNQVAVAGLKYTILRQAIGGDIIYDPTKALSFEGDSGPYLQYATVRAGAVISKAQQANISEVISENPEKSDLLEKLLLRFPEVIEHARAEYAPHYIVTYLTELASTFNSYYANNQIIDEKNPLSSYRVALVKVFVQTMKNGLWVLGIKVPERM
jgi:arginyl-tRNA synthetase